MRPATDTYKTVDGLAIRADVYRPDRSEPVPGHRLHPRRCAHHGQPGVGQPRAGRALPRRWVRGRLDRLPPGARDQAASHRDGSRRRHGLGSWTLALAGIGLDADRLAVVGASAGGYLALLAGHRVRPRPRAIVSFYGYGDIAGPWYSRPDPFYLLEPEVSESDARRADRTPVVGRRGFGQRPSATVLSSVSTARHLVDRGRRPRS